MIGQRFGAVSNQSPERRLLEVIVVTTLVYNIDQTQS
jgi:hypothetical protein